MHSVSFPEKDLNFEVADGDTIFDALEKQGELLPHGCLSGSCGSCRVEVLEGEDNLDTSSPVEQDTVRSIKLNLRRIHGKDYDLDRNVRLACRAKVRGDISFKTI